MPTVNPTDYPPYGPGFDPDVEYCIGGVASTTPVASVWYRIQPVTDTTTPTWVDGSHLVPYQHDGTIPAC